MKKRIPVFSVVCFLNVALALFNGNLSFGMLFPLALGVMALLVDTKPEMKKYAGYVALAWGAVTGFGLLRTAPNLISIIKSGGWLILASVAYRAVYCVFALLAAMNLMTGKKEKITGRTYFLIGLALTFVYMLTALLQEVSYGNLNVFSVFVRAFFQVLPSLTTFGAIALLYGAFAEPASTPVMDQQKIKILVGLVIVTALMLTVAYIFSNAGSGYTGNSGYTGKTYDSFSDYLKDQDPDLYNSIKDRYNSLTP